MRHLLLQRTLFSLREATIKSARGAGVRWTPLRSRSTDRGDSRDHKEYLADKWQDDDNYLFTLMGIARELNHEGITSAKVYLAVGLPITWVGRQREEFRKYMLQRESVDFKYEDKLYSVRIIGCYVYPQGCGCPVDISAKQKHRPRRQPRPLPWWKS